MIDGDAATSLVIVERDDSRAAIDEDGARSGRRPIGNVMPLWDSGNTRDRRECVPICGAPRAEDLPQSAFHTPDNKLQ
jgi:hypothetical protein